MKKQQPLSKINSAAGKGQLFMKKNMRILTIPNGLSFFRFLLIPVYVKLYMNAQSNQDYLFAGMVLGISCITDTLDGWIARRFHQISDLGKILDPVADKVTQCVVLLCMVARYPVLRYVLGLFFIKEAFQLIAGCLYLKKGNQVQGAFFAGKVCTTVLFISMILLMVFPFMPAWGVNLLAGICILAMLAAFWEYIQFYRGKGN